MSADLLYAISAVLTSAGALIAAVTGLLSRRSARKAVVTAEEAKDAATETAATIDKVHNAVMAPNGQTTGDAVAEIADTVRALAKDVAIATAMIGSHVADGHGGHRPGDLPTP